MQVNVARELGAIVRAVENREVDGKVARVVIAARSYGSDIDDVWDALTSAERIGRWFLPISGELELGGRYQFEGNAGGMITRCDPPMRLEATWEYGGSTSWVTVTLQAEGADSTRLELEHVAHVDDEFWLQFGPGAVGVGWDGALLGLALHIAGEGPADPKEGQAWQLTEEGKSHSRGSSELWRQATIASGVMTPEQADAAAARTTAFYTGEA